MAMVDPSVRRRTGTVIAIFWVSLALVAYAYVGYPCLLALWARLRPRAARRRRLPATAPGVSIIVAACNEAPRIQARLDNLLSLAYAGPMQIVVVSDGSTDATADVMKAYRNRVDFVEIPPSGKAAALNAGVRRARHPILVFADARQTFAADAIAELVAHFVDPSIGGVTGELVLDCEGTHERASESKVGEGVGLYWRYEKWIRRNESLVHSTLGATGAIYALRRRLWTPLPAGTILDDVLAPMRVVLQGHRVVFGDRAKAYDRAAIDGLEEQQRKARTLEGNYQILALEPALLHPLRNPVWLQYVSHKIVGRLIAPFALMTLFASSVALAAEGGLYAVALAGQALVYALATYGAARDGWARGTRSSVAAGRWSRPRVQQGVR
jgi:cellulose synthase/poly-beta-1,6-N-acetylglucosamine synthase-like glycosyltransferase